MSCKHVMTRNITTNECRHKNYKYGEDRVQKNFNMAQLSHKMNEKRMHGVNKPLKGEATLMSASYVHTTNISDDINTKDIQWFYNI